MEWYIGRERLVKAKSFHVVNWKLVMRAGQSSRNWCHVSNWCNKEPVLYA